MIIYKDIISGDELFSNTFPVKEIGAAYEVDAKFISIETDEDGGQVIDLVADENGNQVIDLVYSYKLIEIEYDKKSYMTYIKVYMKHIKTQLDAINPSRVPAFQEEATVLVKKIVENFNDYQFFLGKSMNFDGMVVLLNYREDGVTPYFTFLKTA